MKILNTERILNTEYRILNSMKKRGEFLHSVFSIRNSVFATLGIFGTIENPLGTAFGEADQYSTVTSGLPLLISNIVRLVTLAAGIWMFFNFIIAGLTYITAGGQTEKINQAWAMIWQSLVGLIIVVAAFAITALASQILFGSPGVILNPVIYGPGKAQ